LYVKKGRNIKWN